MSPNKRKRDSTNKNVEQNYGVEDKWRRLAIAAFNQEIICKQYPYHQCPCGMCVRNSIWNWDCQSSILSRHGSDISFIFAYASYIEEVIETFESMPFNELNEDEQAQLIFLQTAQKDTNTLIRNIFKLTASYETLSAARRQLVEDLKSAPSDEMANVIQHEIEEIDRLVIRKQKRDETDFWLNNKKYVYGPVLFLTAAYLGKQLLGVDKALAALGNCSDFLGALGEMIKKHTLIMSLTSFILASAYALKVVRSFIPF